VSCLEAIANLASILTAFLAAGAWIYYTDDRCRKRRKLENYLKGEKDKNTDQGQRTMIHLMSKLRMSQDDILRAAFHSQTVKCTVVANKDTGLATQLLFEYGNPN
jgi:hypothetical protein